MLDLYPAMMFMRVDFNLSIYLSVYLSNISIHLFARSVSGHDVHEGGFSGPTGSHDGGQLPRLELPAHSLHHNNINLAQTSKKGILFSLR